MQSSLKSFLKALTKPGRERRLPIHVPLTYRRVGEKVWHGGATRDISLSGVLFQAEQPMAIGVPVEIKFRKPVDTGEEAGDMTFCRGKIVRTVLAPAAKKYPVLAARVYESRLKPRPVTEIRKWVGDDRGPMSP